MSTGLAPVRGALFAWVVLHLGGGVEGASPSARGYDDAPIGLKWLTDLGAESATTPRARELVERETVVATVPGAAYVLSMDEHASPQKQKRIPAHFSIPYGLAISGGSFALTSSDGSLSLWSAAPEAPSLDWRREIDERVSSVSWDGGDVLWITTRGNRLVALSRAGGETIWSSDIGGRAEAPATREGDAIFVATKDKSLLRLNATTGDVEWRQDLPGPAHHPPVVATSSDASVVFCGTWNGHLVAFDAASGTPIWSAVVEGRLAGPLVSDSGLVAVSTEAGAVHAYTHAGAPLWSAEDVASGAADLLTHRGSDGRPRLVVVSKVLTALDPATGEVLDDYPEGAVQEVERRFLDAMLEGEGAYSESEKSAILAEEIFPIRGRLFGRARLFGRNLIFATEDGWLYWFDVSSLRALALYRAGHRASARPIATSTTLVATASEAVFGLDGETGRSLWKRDLGAVKGIAAGEKLAVVGDDRIDVIDLESGSRQWSAHGEFSAAFALGAGGFLALTRHGRVLRFDENGNVAERSLELEVGVETATALNGESFAVVTTDGRIVTLTRGVVLRRGWEVSMEDTVEALNVAGRTLVVESPAALVGLARLDGSRLWELPLTEQAVVQVSDAVYVFEPERLRVFDAQTGALRLEKAVEDRALGAAVTDDALVWLDGSGRAHRSEIGVEAPTVNVDLKVRLSDAAFTNGAFLVTTESGEVGLVEIVAQPAAAKFEQEGSFR